jgi:formylmethanofuran dehydrogenase subunit A
MTEKDYFQLLMEETGCKCSEAELALFLSNNNLGKAITAIGFILKFITIFKIKIIFPKGKHIWTYAYRYKYENVRDCAFQHNIFSQSSNI